MKQGIWFFILSLFASTPSFSQTQYPSLDKFIKQKNKAAIFQELEAVYSNKELPADRAGEEYLKRFLYLVHKSINLPQQELPFTAQELFDAVPKDDTLHTAIIVKGDQLATNNRNAPIVPSPQSSFTTTMLVDFYEKAQQLCAKNEKWELWITNETSMAKLCYYGFQPIDKVEYHYKRALEKAQSTKSPQMSNLCLLIASYYFGHEQDMEQAEIYYKKAAELDSIKSSLLHSQLSNVYEMKGDLERALEYGLKSCESNLPPGNLVWQYAKNALMYLKQNQIDLAGKQLEKAKNIASNQKDYETYNNIGYAYLAMAEAKYEECKYGVRVPINTLLTKSTHIRIVEAYELLLDFDLERPDLELLANRYAVQSAEDSQIPSESKVYAGIAQNYRRFGEHEKVLEYTDKGLRLLSIDLSQEQNIQSRDKTVLKLLLLRLQALSELNKTDASKYPLKSVYGLALNCVDMLDQLRRRFSSQGAKEKLLEEVPMVYEAALSACWGLYEASSDAAYLEQAFLLSEKSRAMLLLDALKEDDARRFGGIPDSLRLKEKALLADIAYFESELDMARRQKNEVRAGKFEGYLFQKRNELEALKKELERLFPKYFELKYKDETPSVADFRKALDGDMVLVEYFWGKNHWYVFGLSKDKIWAKRHAQTEDPASSLKDRINNFLSGIYDFEQTIKNPDAAYKRYAQPAHELYGLLVKELREHFPTAQQWVLIPDGVLSYLPFEILLTQPAPEQVGYKDLDYLLRHWIISYHYSATLWLQSHLQAHPYEKGILGIAATYQPVPPMSPERQAEWGSVRAALSELTGAQQEVASLESNYSGKYFYKEQATEAALLQQTDRYGILHFAVHGLVNERSVSRSGLVLTENGDSLHDNMLLAHEIPNLSLRADMVVLSACETARGKYQSGEGVMSIGRGFLYAGANSVTMTLWEVNDLSGKRLVELFYKNLAAGLPKNKALQKAKLDYLQQTGDRSAHPFFWSPYILIGNTQPTRALQGSGRAWLWWTLGGILAAGGASLFLRRSGRES